jgi:hypothetical protein
MGCIRDPWKVADVLRSPFVLFASSERVRGDEAYVVASSLSRFRAFQFFAPTGPDPKATRDPDGGPRYEFPGEVGRCVRMAVELAKSTSTALRVIDITRPGDAGDLIQRWVTPETLFPLLVAPDGRRLEGIDWFVPSIVRKFYRGR